MEKYQDIVTRNTGNGLQPVRSASVTVYATGTTTKSTIYSDNGTTTAANPLTANGSGFFSFYAADGTYDLLVSGDLISDYTISGIQLFSAASSSGAAGVGFIQSGTGAVARTVQTEIRQLQFNVQQFGALGDGSTDDSSAIQAAVNAASTLGGCVFFPTTALGYKVSTGIAITARPITIRGDDFQSAIIFTTSDITIFSFTINASKSIVRDLYIQGPGGTSTKPGVLFTNANYTRLDGVYITSFSVGVRYSPGINSCYLCSISNSQIVNNASINIDLQASTAALTIYNTSFGGTTATGLKSLDASFYIYGGDCEGVSTAVMTIDGSSALNAGIIVSGLHMENNVCASGDIQIGTTSQVNGVLLTGNFYKVGGTTAVNAIKCDGLIIQGGVLHSGGTLLTKGAGLLTYLVSKVHNASDDSSVITYDQLFTDATYDIGKSGATRPRDGFFSRNFVIGGTLGVTGHVTLEGVTSTGATGTGKIVSDTSPRLTNTGINREPVAAVAQSIGFDNSSYVVGTLYRPSADASGQTYEQFQLSDNTTVGSITRNAATSAVLYNTTSDYRVKELDKPFSGAMDIIKILRVWSGRMKGGAHTQPLLVAHEAQPNIPWAVTGEKDAMKDVTNDDGEVIGQVPEYQQIDYGSSIVPLLIVALQEQNVKIAALEEKLGLTR